MEELKPCPFCGEIPETPVYEDEYSSWSIDCGNCGLRMFDRTDDSLVKQWNRRDDTIRESYCRLVEECIHLKEQRDEAVELLKTARTILRPNGWPITTSDIGIYLDKIKA